MSVSVLAWVSDTNKSQQAVDNNNFDSCWELEDFMYHDYSSALKKVLKVNMQLVDWRAPVNHNMENIVYHYNDCKRLTKMSTSTSTNNISTVWGVISGLHISFPNGLGMFPNKNQYSVHPRKRVPTAY